MITTAMCRFILLGLTVLVTALPDENTFTGTGALLLSDRDPTVLRRCRYDKVFGMLQARCADLNLNEIPASLRKDVQILDFSGNRLRKLTNETLKPFSSLAYLYLMDNFIRSFGAITFAHLKNLQVLDMTKNEFTDFPKNIFSLTQLKKLYLGQNHLTNAAVFTEPSQGESNLELLDLSQNLLTKIPQLQSLSQLKYLNISGNAITKLVGSEIAIFCSLEVLDISSNPLKFNDECECQEFNSWIEFRKIKMFPSLIKCSDSRRRRRSNQLSTRCSTLLGDNLFANETLRVFDICKQSLKQREETVKARTTWIVVCSCVGVFLVFLFIALYFIHKRNKKRKLRSPKKDLGVTNNHHAAEELLNENK